MRETPRGAFAGAARRWVPAALAVLAVALAPLAASSAFGLPGLAILSVLTLASLGPWRAARAAALALVPCVAYAGGVASASTPTLLLVAWSAAAVGVVLPQPRRGLLALVAGAAAAVLVLTMRVLSSGPWGPELSALPALAAGLGLAAAAAGAVLCWRELATPSRLERVPSAVALVALVIAFGRALAGGDVPRSPAWYRQHDALEHARAAGSRPAMLAALEDLDAAGAADAALVRVALALGGNADPATVRSLCPRGRRLLLDATWAPEVELGRRACAVARSRPGDPVRTVGPAEAPALRRLVADLLAGAGEWQAALALYREAANGGDPFAERDAVLGLIAAGRLDDARQLAPAPDPTYSLWLGGDVAPAAAWGAWSRLLDLDGLEPPSRRGLRVVEGEGELASVYDRAIGRHVLVSRTRAGPGFAVALPPTPAGAVPGRLAVWMLGEGALRIDVQGAGDTSASFGCGIPELPPPSPAVCAGLWDEPVLPLAGVRPPLSSIVVRGSFRLARVQAAP